MSEIPAGTAADFAKYIAENKPYLIEIEEEIQTLIRGLTGSDSKQGKLRIEVNIRGGRVVTIDLWRARHWKLSSEESGEEKLT